MIPVIIILAAVLAIVVWCIRTVNDFKRKEIRIQEGLSGVEVALTKRYDMLTKMLDAAKGYMKHENELFEKVIELRRGMSVTEMNDAQQQIDSLSGKFFAVAEGYPELRSSDVFVELQRGIRDAEEHLQAARRLYNTSVSSYNTAIAMFPAKLLAGSRQPQEFFAADAGKREDVKMTF
ncbi:MAG: LemA family protein [Eubacteriales bacterium]